MGKKDKKDKKDKKQATSDVPASAETPKLGRKEYEAEMRMLHGELVAMQEWVKATGAKVCVVFEGRDTAGKGGTIKRITERVSPRVFRVVALSAPTEREKSQMYVQRYVPHFPAAGEVVIFDRSWYNRAGVEPVMGFCSHGSGPPASWNRSPAFEKAMVESGIMLIKYWLEVGPDEQTRRLESRINDPRKIWKLSDMDLKSYSRWYDYSRARDAMFAATDTAWAPWFVAHTDDKKRGRLNIITHLLGQIPYQPLPHAGRQAAQAEERPAATWSPTSRCATSRRSSERSTCRRTAGDGRQRMHESGEVGCERNDQVNDSSGPRADDRWYALSADEVATAARRRPRRRARPRRTAAERLQTDGPNALPAEKAVPGWRRFLEQYRSYMQIILLIAGVVSLAIGEWSTGALLLLLTVVNAVVGLRQEGKAESAMNALKSMTKQHRAGTPRRRRGRDPGGGGRDRRRRAAQPPATTWRPTEGSSRRTRSTSTSPPSPARARRHRRRSSALADAELGPGDQTNMAFMNTPVTHGSGMMLVTARGADAEVGKIAGMLSATAKEQTPLTKQLNTMTLWIGAAALGDDDRHVRARASHGARPPTRCSSPPSPWRSRRSRRRCRPCSR